MVCSGDNTQYCGSGNRLELYSTTATITATPTPTPTPSHVETVQGYTLVGCWNEIPNGRVLNQRLTTDPDMTNELCASFCHDFRYMATQYGNECYCGSHVSGATESAPLEDCSMPCAGDALSYCGGSNRLELYMNEDVAGGDPEQPLAAGEFAWYGCQTEADGVRTLGAAVKVGDDMTNEVCAEFCAEYEFFGTEYGSECYCGDEIADGSEEAADGECGMLCAGSVMEYCGAGYRLSVYKKKEIVEVI